MFDGAGGLVKKLSPNVFACGAGRVPMPPHASLRFAFELLRCLIDAAENIRSSIPNEFASDTPLGKFKLASGPTPRCSLRRSVRAPILLRMPIIAQGIAMVRMDLPGQA